MKLQKIGLTLLIIFIVVLILIYAQSIIVPLILSTLLWFLIKEFRELFNNIKWVKNNIPRWTKTLFASLVLVVILGFFSNILINNIETLRDNVGKYTVNMQKMGDNIEAKYGIDIGKKIKDFNGKVDLGKLVGDVLNSFSSIFSNTLIILIYLIFILMEESTFVLKLKAIYSDKKSYEEATNILNQIDKSISKYISIKTLTSIITAVLSYVVLALLKIDCATFWAFLIFILNFIPSIGSLIGTLFPTLMALILYGDTTFTPAILVLVFVGIIQVIIGNFVEPKMMGNSLNISSLIVIISLSVWGVLWGIVGMVLSVPITVIMIIVFSHFPSTRSVAILLSEKGQIS